MAITCLYPPNIIPITLDLKKEYTKQINVQQYDTLLLQIDLLENSKKLDLSDKTIQIDFLNANNTQTEVSQDSIEIGDSKVNILLPQNCTLSPGVAKFQIRIFCGHGAEMSSYAVNITIIKSIIESIAESENVIALIDGGFFNIKNFNEYDGGVF